VLADHVHDTAGLPPGMPVGQCRARAWGDVDGGGAVVVIVAATVAGGALWKVFHSVRHVIWFFVGGLIVSAALLRIA